MNYVFGRHRSQVQMECLDDFVESDSEVRVIDKIIATKQRVPLRSTHFLEGPRGL
jgi:hypothetical protein